MDKPRSYAFYGRSGTGKTTLASTFPKPLLLLDVQDEGTDSISDVKQIDVMEITHWGDIEDAYWWLKKNPGKYKTVVIDTVTQMQQVAIAHVLSLKKKQVDNPGDWGTMTKREWGDVAQLMKKWIIDFRDLPMEVIFLAQDRVFNVDEDSGDNEESLAPEVGPRLSPSVAAALNAAVGVVGNTFVRLKYFKKEVKGKTVEEQKVQYCLRVGPNPVYITKIRKPKSVEPPAFLVDPSYEDLDDTIKGL